MRPSRTVAWSTTTLSSVCPRYARLFRFRERSTTGERRLPSARANSVPVPPTLPANLAGSVGGTGTLFARAEGKRRSPVVDLSLNLNNLAYRGQTLDSVVVDHATVREGRIQADTIEFAKTEPAAPPVEVANATAIGASAAPAAGTTYEGRA